MELSVIIPTYNSSSTIIPCLESIMKQKNAPEFEVIVINDGSTDNTLEIIKNYKSKYKNLFVYSQKNQRQSVARNYGLKKSKGKYIVFMDSDDICSSEFLKYMYEGIESIKGDLGICSIYKVDLNENKNIECPNILVDWNDKKLYEYLIYNNEADVGLWNKIFKAEIIKENDIYFKNENFFEDSLFIFEYLKYVRSITYIDKPLYTLIKNEGSTTLSFNNKIEKLAESYMEKVNSFLVNNGTFSEKLFLTFQLRIYIYLFHYQIKNSNQIKNYLKMHFKKKDILINKLSMKYYLAAFCIYYFPVIYKNVYLKKFKNK